MNVKTNVLIGLGALVLASCQKQSEPIVVESPSEELLEEAADPPPMTTQQFEELQEAVANKYSKTYDQLEQLRNTVDDKGAKSPEAMALKAQIMKELEPKKEALTEMVTKVIAEKGQKSPEAIALNVELFKVIDFMGDVKLADLPASKRPGTGSEKRPLRPEQCCVIGALAPDSKAAVAHHAALYDIYCVKLLNEVSWSFL